MAALILAVIALLIAVCAALVAIQTWRHAPGARLWAELRLRIEDLEADSDALHDRIHTNARRQNVAKATETRVATKKEKDTLLEQATAALAPGAARTARPGGPPATGDEEETLAYWRRRAGMH